MPHRGESDRVTAKEWKEYRRRQAEQALVDPDYESGFRRPLQETISAAWELLEPFFAERLPQLAASHGWLEERERAELRTVAKTALVIALDSFIAAGFAHRTITVGSFFDALARRYSDHHRQSIAGSIWSMRRDTVMSCRRDLHLNGVKVKELWELATGSWSDKDGANPLFWTESVMSVGQQVFPRENSGILAQFQEIISQDRRYRSKRRVGRRLLFVRYASQRKRARALRQRICAELPYDVAVNGRRGERLLDEQEKAVLLFNAEAFMEDYRRADVVERQLLKELQEVYQIDPRRSDARRGRRYWSPRQEWIYFRVIHEGFRLGWEEGDRHLNELVRKRLHGDENTAEQTEEERKKRKKRAEETRQKYERHCRNYMTWRKKACETYNVPVVAEAGPRVLTPVDIVKAHAVAHDFRRTVRDLIARYDRAHTHVSEYGGALAQVERFTAIQRRLFVEISVSRRRRKQEALTPGPYVEIKTRVDRLANRRYQTRYLWPPEVAGKSDPIAEAEGIRGTRGTLRSRWFKAEAPEVGEVCELVGFDVSSSQTQILAVAFGLRELEDEIVKVDREERRSFKEILAREAWRMSEDSEQKFELRKGYKEADDPRLVELVKELWMRVLYGSPPAWVVIQQQDDWMTYGPGWTVKNAKEFLKEQPFYQLLGQYLDFAREIAQRAFRRSRYAGLRLKDPFDRIKFRWNPVERDVDVLKSMGQQLRMSLPGRVVTTRHVDEFEPNSPNKRGEYPVSEKQLYRKVTPQLVHMLDAFFSSLVMEKLAKKGVRDFVGIHDCWLVPARVRLGADIRDGREVLRETLEDATRDWYKGLGTFYDSLESHVDKDGHSGRFLAKARDAWRNRLRAGRKGPPPKFVVREANSE
jgi:hypothetical protein